MKNSLKTLLTFSIVMLLSSVVYSQGKLKIYILAGQSNMEGHGKISADQNMLTKNGGMGSLDYTIQNDINNTFSHLKDSGGNYVKRGDVWVYYKRGGIAELTGDLSTEYGSDPTNIGPELQFGHVMGDHHGEQVLIIKTAWGGKSLANDFLSPRSAGSNGYSKVPTTAGDQGFYFMETIKIVRDVVANIKTHFPAYDGKGYEIAGFGWHQGWNDVVVKQFVDAYESNMRNFILDVRDSLGVPKLPFVVGLSGMHGPLSNFQGQSYEGRVVGLWNAQFAMADYAKYPDFAGNVTTVDTRDYWRIHTDSPSNQEYHWSGNAETYFWIGDAMAKGMQELVGGTQNKIKVFILAGQSNAQGHGDLGPITTAGTLEHFYANKQSNEYDFIKDSGSNWATRSDVWVRYDDGSNGLKADDLKVGYGGWSQQIGPEYGMGHALGKHFDDQVLIIKTAWGGKSLAVDFRPPSAGGTTGPYYTQMINDIKASINNIATEFPGYSGETIEIAGFVWFQGWNDGGSDAYLDEYQSNLINLIKDVPTDLNIPNLPILVGLTGNGGRSTTNSDGWIKGLQTRLVPAQIGAVQATTHACVDYAETRDFWVDPTLSPGNGLHHWNNNAESYLRIGNEFGVKLIDLLNNNCSITTGITDCNGDVNGTAFLDGCSICVEGNTGKSKIVNGIPEGYSFLGNEGDTKTLPTKSNVVYGQGCSFSYLHGVTGSVAINNGTFGDPAPGVVKKAYYKAIDIVTSIDQQTTVSGLNIYPNPARGQVTIEGEFSNWILMDSRGAKIKAGTEKVIDVGSLNSGLYYLRVDGEVRKFIKM
jgi:hypothetical protein